MDAKLEELIKIEGLAEAESKNAEVAFNLAEERRLKAQRDVCDYVNKLNRTKGPATE